MFMTYYKTYTTYDVLGMILDLDKSNVGRDIKYLEPAIKQSITIHTKKYADSKKINSLQQLLEFFPELIAITNGTEQSNPERDPKIKRREKFTIQEKRKNILYKIKLL